MQSVPTAMAEVLGVAASAIEVANLGFKLSTSLYSYIETVSSADRRLREVATKVELTTAVIQEVGLIFDGPEIVALRKESAVTTAKNTLRECSSIFEEIEDAVVRSKKNKFTFPFRTSKLSALSTNLESLKSNLSLLLHVLQHAHRIASDEKARKETEDRIRERDEALKELQKQLSAGKDASTSLPPYDAGQGGGIFIGLHQQFPDQAEKDPPQKVSKITEPNGRTDEDSAAQKPTRHVTAEELESCVSGLKKLIEHIERFQKTIPVAGEPEPTNGNALLHTYAEVSKTLEEVIPRCGPAKGVKADEERVAKTAKALGSEHDTVPPVDEEGRNISLERGHPVMLASSRPAIRGKYQFEADSDEEIDLEGISDIGVSTHLLELGRATGEASVEYSESIHRISQKSDSVNDQVALNRARLDRLGGYTPIMSTNKQKVGLPTEPESQRSGDAVDELLKEWTNVYDL
ncbi:hypothetical protein SLS56_012188 [Neofusicoccum ribis]|uniref:Fungal N-terminal domain-containing protein n=1 Tax=Neofusicoccum ribis TaxID=45134 RepID=A0ABR3S9H8_9PEZI